jgi:hypothetical protein
MMTVTLAKGFSDFSPELTSDVARGNAAADISRQAVRIHFSWHDRRAVGNCMDTELPRRERIRDFLATLLL